MCRRGLRAGTTIAAAAALAGTLLAGCWAGEDERRTQPPTQAPTQPAIQPQTRADVLGAKLAEAFRIDVSDIEVRYDFWPSDHRIRGSAVLRFEMRPGQTRPLFHFNPLRNPQQPEQDMLRTVTLDGERLDATDEQDLRRVRPLPSAEWAFEAQRELAPGEAHTLRVPYLGPRDYPGWFYANFDDTIGPGDETETLWPTVSSPEEFARHRFRFRVHSDRRYTMLGSGVVRRRPALCRPSTWTPAVRSPAVPSCWPRCRPTRCAPTGSAPVASGCGWSPTAPRR